MSMTTARTAIPSGPWTVDDLDDFPEGGTTRYELIDGALLVTAEPSLQHQRVCLLVRVLEEAGVPSYWLVDPDDGVLTALELGPDGYQEVARGRELSLSRPFVVEVRLSR